MRAVEVTRRVRASFGAFGLCAALGTAALPPSAEAKASFTILPAGTAISGINDNGAVAGSDNGAGFLRTPDGTITTFRVMSDSTAAVSININDVITGTYFDGSDVSHGFTRTADGTVITFDAPGAGSGLSQGTFPLSINASGVVTGYYVDSANLYHGFVRAVDGTITSVDVGQSSGTMASCINDKGSVTGSFADAGTSHGFVRNARGKITQFDVPGDNLGTLANCINSKGVIVGTYADNNGVFHDYIRAADGTFQVFDAPGPNGIPTGLNSKGAVVGVYAVNRKGIGFLRKPDGTIRNLHVPGAQGGVDSLSINSSGVIAGYFLTHPDKHTTIPWGFIRTP